MKNADLQGKLTNIVTLVTDLFFRLMVHLFHGLEIDILQILIYALVNSSMLDKISCAFFEFYFLFHITILNIIMFKLDK